ncbi:hypothetical protein [Rhodococcus sp. T7]|nr:hypothetical protein [Rhodococcus sp. T7]KAF0957879.1 hypothetical protein MLGJGCBP_09711 [Rhodococcus sp. T7]KAF0962917.1 hypothetical protein MLGJGCBP_03956 [Rhodococcus sp. T7]
MISSLFRIAAIPVAIFLDHLMAPRRIREFYENIDEYGAGISAPIHEEVS